MHDILAFLDSRMALPKVLGWYHILCLVVMFSLCVFVVLKCRNLTEKQLRVTFIVVSIVMFVLEAYKQINFAYDVATKSWSYAWYIFPFQFCSTPMYLIFIAGVIKNGKLKDAIYGHLATFGLFAGLSVVLVPSAVFVTTIGVNIQTMFHHGAMVVIGVLIHANNKIKYEHKSILGPIYIFLVLSAIAFTLNFVIYAILPDSGFNMFFISPYYDCIIPILGFIKNYVPYIVFLFLYLSGFSAIAYIILWSVWFIRDKYNCRWGKYYKIG